MISCVGIVSLSAGTIGESFVKHEVEIGIRRLEEYGLKVKFLPHALSGIDYVKKHPKERAEDLLEAFCDPEIDMILSAIGGDDTYRLLPYLFNNNELRDAIKDKVFLGYSDTTMNHLMLSKVGLKSFYGQSFLSDICELDNQMLPYTEKYFKELITTGTIHEITPSDIWYENRTNFDVSQIGIPMVSHPNNAFELLQGKAEFSGKILGGCIDTLFDLFDGERYEDSPFLCKRYSLFPDRDEWRGKILLLESSEEQMPPEKYRRALNKLKETGIFSVISGVLVGKPMNEKYHDEYRQILKEVIGDPSLPVVCNISIGHALPRCIVPFGVEAHVDTNSQKILFDV